MSVAETKDLREYCLQVAQTAKAAAGELALVRGGQKNDWLRDAARRMRDNTAALQQANQLDLAAAPGFGLTDAQIDRLKLTPERIDGRSPGPWRTSPPCPTRWAR